MNNKWIKPALCLALVASLSACSKLSHNNTPAGVSNAGDQAYSQDSTTAQGMGESAGVREEQSGDVDSAHYRPHSDTYYFAFDSSAIRSEDMQKLKAAANYISLHKGARVLVEGNTDERGSREYNIGLGERRAKSVADILRWAGVEDKQFRLVSYGQEKPAVLGHDEAAYQKNRRVELSYEATPND